MSTIYIAAKLNLFLEITGVRPDGYHLLHTVMQSIDIYDTLTLLDAARPFEVLCTGVSQQENTAYKAGIAFFERSKHSPQGVIRIEKQIPMGAGMGGSSADAAGVLQLLNQHYNAPLTHSELADIAVAIGADVPFMLQGGTMLCQGIGESLQPVTSGLDGYFLVLQPAGQVDTKAAYALYDQLGGQSSDLDAFLQALANNDLRGLAPLATNALQQAATKLCPEISPIYQYLETTADFAFLTGSGSACVGYFADKAQAQAVLKAAPACAVYKKIAQAAKTPLQYIKESR